MSAVGFWRQLFEKFKKDGEYGGVVRRCGLRCHYARLDSSHSSGFSRCSNNCDFRIFSTDVNVGGVTKTDGANYHGRPGLVEINILDISCLRLGASRTSLLQMLNTLKSIVEQ